MSVRVFRGRKLPRSQEVVVASPDQLIKLQFSNHSIDLILFPATTSISGRNKASGPRWQVDGRRETVDEGFIQHAEVIRYEYAVAGIGLEPLFRGSTK